MKYSIADISPCKDNMDYVRIAFAIETLKGENKNYLWTGNEAKISETIQNLLYAAIIEAEEKQ